MKMLEEIKSCRKDFVFETYTKIVQNFKNYEKITKVKMLEAIYKAYSDYKNIIDICTTRELKYLKIVMENDERYKDKKYDWERKMLYNKFLINYDFYGVTILPEEIEVNIKKAIEHVNWNVTKKLDTINELMIGYCKIQGTCLLDVLISFTSSITGIDEKKYKNTCAK